MVESTSTTTELKTILIDIITRASSLSNFHLALSNHPNFNLSSIQYEPTETTEKRLKLWSEIVSKGDWEQFQRRLNWDGLNLEIAHLLASDESYNLIRIESPESIAFLERLGKISPDFLGGKQQESQILDQENPIPFEDLLLPYISVAREELKKLLGNDLENYDQLLNPKAQCYLERNLLNALAYLFTPTLMQEFSDWRQSGNALIDYFEITVQGANKREKYQSFIDKHLQDGFISLFQKYPVLARLAITKITFWAETVAEFVQRLQADWSAIEQCFSPQNSLSQIVNLEMDLSDAHNRGRSVIILTFDSQLKLVYKPKPIALETAFADLLKWCNQESELLDFKVPTILNRSSYGWVSFIPKASCEDSAAISGFYQRAGMLICLIHLLEGNDCHYENLIASGEYPVLVDAETLCHPRVKEDPNINVQEKLSDSVLRTALLPHKSLSDPNEVIAMDVSGLGAVQEITAPSLTLQHMNTDGMRVETEETTTKIEAHVPKLQQQNVSPDDFIDDIINGFEQMYRWLIRQRERLLSPDSPLMSFANQECRFLFRNTKVYAAILTRSYRPHFLESGIAHSVGLDPLSRAYVMSSEKPKYWPILAAEKQAMEQLDIPLLSANTSSTDLPLSTGEVIDDFFATPSFDQVMANVRALNEADLQLQMKVIRLAFYASAFSEPEMPSLDVVSGEGKEVRLPAGSEWIKEATAIATFLEEQAFALDKDEINWLGIGYQHSSQSFHIQELGLNVYDGLAGVALFFGALFKVTEDSHWRELAQTTLKRVSNLTELDSSQRDRALRSLGIGGATGAGSMVYALTYLSQWLQDSHWQELAETITQWIPAEKISSDRALDVVGGTAGYLLGLLTLSTVSTGKQYDQIIEQAQRCGEHLLQQQEVSEEKPQGWRTWRGQQLSGFSQGAAGVAYALLRLFAVTGDKRFFEAAEHAIDYEQTLFSESAQNWQDLRASQPHFGLSWAQGAPGIALARLGGLSVLDTPAIRQQIEIALNTTQAHLAWGIDSLCWGTLGRAESLLVAGQTLNDPYYSHLAYQVGATVYEQAKAQGQYQLFARSSVPAEIINPGFFQGLSGIGYSLLRLASPHQLPSILLWQ